MKKAYLIPVFVLGLITMGAMNSLSQARSYAQTISTTAAAVASTVDGFGWKSCIIGNFSATPVYLGGADVTTANGFPICTDTAACTRADMPADFVEGVVYAVVGSGTQAIRAFCGR